jgi:hypothetical protein
MLKYLGIFAVVIGLSVFVTVQDEHHTDHPAQKSTQLNSPVAPTEANKEHTQEHIEEPKGNPPSWHAFFVWPNGAGAWAVFLTLFAIIEQTIETRKSADAALLNAQVMVNAERALLLFKVTKEHSHDRRGTYRFRIEVVNCGNSPARDIAEIRAGRMVVVVDDEDRENEGDLTLAAEFVTPEAINFMARYGRGLICLTLTEERADHLRLFPMTQQNSSRFGTAFTETIEAREGVTTGISAATGRTRSDGDRCGGRHTIWRGRGMCFRCGRARAECWCGRGRRRLRWTWRGWRG